ncbi:hypothetical protein Sliba_00440 [Streptomyces nigrescens]|uniref:Uncharacterized protein n=1 Tax=Streptomyces nigrescens TaxID=1920 RepID=A0A640TAS9_STRNI|nr:hypothetical protein Sliba_00440 [Streptomyces libani subsp. libani]GGW04590.1 hypothetical protein GCM10010500_66970 [Streptomyces libani subsp. libani]
MQGGFAARSKGGHDALEAGGAQVAGDEDAWVLGGGKAVASCIACIADDVAGRGSRCVTDAEEDGIGRSGPPFAGPVHGFGRRCVVRELQVHVRDGTERDARVVTDLLDLVVVALRVRDE